jgi:hypothetical protein
MRKILVQPFEIFIRIQTVFVERIITGSITIMMTTAFHIFADLTPNNLNRRFIDYSLVLVNLAVLRLALPPTG